MTDFNAESTTNDVIDGISLSGKLVVVTGAASGLGTETARTLAVAGATVLMLGRDEGKLKLAVDTLLAEDPGLQLDTAITDLADLDDIRQAATDIVNKYPKIDLLINNAGVMACPPGRTAQGFETQFGTNHLGHFLLSCLLAPALIAAEKCRVISLSSSGHKFANVDFDDPNYLRRDYEKWAAYGQSKTANVLFSVALDDHLKDYGVRSLAVHPGVIMTNLGRHMLQEDFDMFEARLPEGEETKFKNIPQGAATTVWASTSAELEGQGAIYLEDCHIAEPAIAGIDGGIEAYALDRDAAGRLWALSEELVGQSFDFYQGVRA